jgi:hypothetical protein
VNAFSFQQGQMIGYFSCRHGLKLHRDEKRFPASRLQF